MTTTFFIEMKEGFRIFGHSISAVVNLFLLLIVYVLGIGLVSIPMKLFNKKFLEVRMQGKNSMWKKYKTAEKKLEDYYRTW